MPYAFVTHVQFPEGADPELGRKMLQEGLIPAAKAQAGFQSGIWVRSGELAGIGTIVFDTKANAEAGKAALEAQRPAEAPAITDSGIYEVVAQA